MLPGPHVTVNGKPSCNVRMPPSCQPPSTKSATPPRFISARFLPNGRSHSQEVVQRRRKSKAESPVSRPRAEFFDGVSESPSVVRAPLPVSLDFPYENELRKLTPCENRFCSLRYSAL